MTRGANYCCIVTNKNAPDSKHFALFKTYKFPTNWCEFQNSNPGEIEKAMQRFQVNLYYICTAGRLTMSLCGAEGVFIGNPTYQIKTLRLSFFSHQTILMDYQLFSRIYMCFFSYFFMYMFT